MGFIQRWSQRFFRAWPGNPSTAKIKSRQARLGVHPLEARCTPAARFDWAATATLGNSNAGWEKAEDIATDSAGNSYVVGTFNGAADFDTTDSDPTTHSHLVLTTGTYPNPDSPTGNTYLESAFVAKYNADG